MTDSESDQSAVIADAPATPPLAPFTPSDLVVSIDGVDISGCAIEGSATRRLNRPAMAQIKVPMDCSDCGAPGSRLKISFDGGSSIFFHGMVMDWELDGGEDTGYITMNAADPMELWAHRPVRDDDGDFTNPQLLETYLYGGVILLAALSNSEGDSTAQGNAFLTPPATAEGPLFLDFSSFSSDGPQLTGAPVDWPMTIAEFANLLISTGELDVVITPTDPGGGIMGSVDTYAGNYGTDLSGSVVFEYGTGAKNVRALRWNKDMSNITNKLWYFAGPRIQTPADPAGDQHWCFNVQGDDCCFTGVDNPPHCVCISPDEADMVAAFSNISACRGTGIGDSGDSRGDYGVRMDIQIFDAAGDNCAGFGNPDPERDLYRWLWLAESWARCNPRELIHITPTRGTDIGAFDIGDLVGVTIDSSICGGASGAQRVYQYTISWDADGPLELGELQTSSDVGIP